MQRKDAKSLLFHKIWLHCLKITQKYYEKVLQSKNQYDNIKNVKYSTLNNYNKKHIYFT